MSRINAVFFDLDGTLADTAPDLASALNQLCVEEGKNPLSFDVVRPVVSNGGNALIELAFDLPRESNEFKRLRNRFLDIYHQTSHQHTTLFPGIDHTLEFLESNGYRWGVVTNKPAWLTEPLVEILSLDNRACCVISGDTTSSKKPHPAPLYLACERSGCLPAQSVYIGDAKRDIDAGIAAGMKTLGALYGYIEQDDDPTTWGADKLIKDGTEIITWLLDQD